MSDTGTIETCLREIMNTVFGVGGDERVRTRWEAALSRLGETRVTAKSCYDAAKPHILFASFHTGFGDWVLVNRLMAYAKRRAPQSMLVVAVPRAEGYIRFLYDIAVMNRWVDAVIEIPCPDVYADVAAGGNGLIEAELMLAAVLRGVTVAAAHRYSMFPCMPLYSAAVESRISTQRVFDLDKAIVDDGYLPVFEPSAQACAYADAMIEKTRGTMTVIWHMKDAADAAQFYRVLGRIACEMPLTVFVAGAGDVPMRQESWCVPLTADLCSLEQLAALMTRVDLFAGNISGPMHLASAMGTKIVAYYFREWTGIDWSPRQPKPLYEVVYKQAYGHDGSAIDEPRSYGISNVNVARFAPAGDEHLYDVITRMLRKERWHISA